MLEVRGMRLEVRSTKLEVRGTKLEVRSTKLEVRGTFSFNRKLCLNIFILFIPSCGFN